MAGNEMEGGETLKSPSAEVLSAGPRYENTPNDNLHTLASAALAPAVWARSAKSGRRFKEEVGSKVFE